MRIVDKQFIDKNVNTTRTRQHFGKILPHVMGQVVRMYPRLTISNLTQGLKNVYTKGQVKDGFTPINTYEFQWRVDVNFIKKVYIVEDAKVQAGIFELVVAEKYYNKNETFALENGTQLFVVAPGIYKGPKRWAYRVRKVSPTSIIPAEQVKKGKYTRYRSNYHPELSVRGYVKYQFSTEWHRNYISKHRSSDVQSAEYTAAQEYYVERGKKKNDGRIDLEYFSFQKMEKDVLESFLWSRENHLLFGESNFDANGKCTMTDEKGQAIPIGDGVIPQIERFSERLIYSVLTTRWMEDAMSAMRAKSANSTGNTYAFVVNEKLYDQMGRVLRNDLRFSGGNNDHYFTNKNGSKITVGAHYDAYTFNVKKAINNVVDQFNMFVDSFFFQMGGIAA